jgi:hypothetical protein
LHHIFATTIEEGEVFARILGSSGAPSPCKVLEDLT